MEGRRASHTAGGTQESWGNWAGPGVHRDGNLGAWGGIACVCSSVTWGKQSPHHSSITLFPFILLFCTPSWLFNPPGLDIVHQNGKSSRSGPKRKVHFHPELMLDQFKKHQECQIWTSSGQQLPQNKHPLHNYLPTFVASPFDPSTPASQTPPSLHTLPVWRPLLFEQFLKSHSLQIILLNMRTSASSPLPLPNHENFKHTLLLGHPSFKNIAPPSKQILI